jgi:CO/xanthine dehydrogenase FAD-binding subunit
MWTWRRTFTVPSRKSVEIVRPRDLSEAVRLAAEGGRPLAGGTDLFVRLTKATEVPPCLIDLAELAELRAMNVTADGVVIGAAVSHAEILASPAAARLPILRMALETIGSPAIRHMGTLGGNLANASPAGDGLVPLYLLEARVNLVGPGGERVLGVDEFVRGPGKTALSRGEIIRSLFIPFPPPDGRAYFRKVGRRRALYIAVASLGALVWEENGAIREARLALGSVAPTVIRPREVERALVGRPLTVEALVELRDAVSSSVQPISDLRASADYRRRVSGNLLLDLASLQVHV